MENVDLALKSPTYNKAKAMLAKAGYGITLKVLDASHYGVPQARKRLFQIGELHGQHDGLSSYLDCKITTERCTVRQYWEQQGWSQLEFEHYYRHPRTYGRRGVFSIDESSQTIREVNRPIPPTYTAHKGDTEDPATGQVGVYTTKQRSLIQTFSPDFNINGVTKTDAEVMIGNAVPVKLAEFVAGCILQYESDKKHNTASVSRQLAFAYGVTPQKEVSSTHQKRRSNSPHAHSSF